MSFFAAGCKTRPENMTDIPNRPAENGNDLNGLGQINAGNQGSNTTMIAESDYLAHTNWIPDPTKFQADTIHFAYDSSVVRSGDKSKISDVSKYLQANPAVAVRVEGNCDERGTEEYNRSLGERRALAAREVLVGDGIAPDRVDTVSYGQDRPVDPGHNESAWKQNRRDDFILLTPPGK